MGWDPGGPVRLNRSTRLLPPAANTGSQAPFLWCVGRCPVDCYPLGQELTSERSFYRGQHRGDEMKWLAPGYSERT